MQPQITVLSYKTERETVVLSPLIQQAKDTICPKLWNAEQTIGLLCLPRRRTRVRRKETSFLFHTAFKPSLWWEKYRPQSKVANYSLAEGKFMWKRRELAALQGDT